MRTDHMAPEHRTRSPRLMLDESAYRPRELRAIHDPDESDLATAPRVFVHRTCGRRTALNAATVRRYLRDPF